MNKYEYELCGSSWGYMRENSKSNCAVCNAKRLFTFGLITML